MRNVEHGMVLCDSYHKECQGFVFAPKSGRLFLKTSVNAEPAHDPFLEFYVKEEFRRTVNLLQETRCAVPVEKVKDLSQLKCNLPVLDPFNANIMKYIDKTKAEVICEGKHYTKYSDGELSLLRTGKMFSLYGQFLTPGSRLYRNVGNSEIFGDPKI